jgi:hypothetical protein
MQKGKNTNQDTNKKEDGITTPSKRTKKKLNSSNIEPFEKITFKLTETFNNSKQMRQLHQKG